MSALFEATALVVPFENLRMTDVEAVGGKNASLGEMISQLPAGVRVPTGFATTAYAFRQFLAHGGLAERINARLATLATEDVRALAAAAPTGRLRIVGNLPYNISTPILFHLLDAADAVIDQHFMLQKEVVDRMVAAPATAAYGRLSVMLQWRYAMENVLAVPPQAFDPPPKVDSAVVRMVPHAAPAAVDPALLAELVRAAFSQRRKLLRHSLGRWLLARGAQADGFDLQRRAEEVPVAEYVALAQAVG